MISSTIMNQKKFFADGKTRDITFRKEMLLTLKKVICRYEDEILAALKMDLGKCAQEAYMSEILITLLEIKHTVKHLKKWSKPRRVSTPLVHFPAKSMVYPAPFGTSLIIAPWNYPFQLLIAPLISAVAAGNTAVLKPSELAPFTAKVVERMINTNFDPSFITVFTGGVETSKELLSKPFDYIFYTGSPKVGKIVMEAASQHLTPVTLELGGKSPCIVDSGVDTATTARRIVFGKFFNAGQTCVAPDYLLVHENVKDELISRITESIKAFYGKNPQESSDYGRIINDSHFERLISLISGTVATGGQYNAQTRYIAPTLLTDLSFDDPVMQEEIFGPLLPVVTYREKDEIISVINKNSHPLALYLFSDDKALHNFIFEHIPCGGICINDTIRHLVNSNLPFGGIGTSGMGQYHGKWGFDTFSHQMAVMTRSLSFDSSLIYPPYRIPAGLLKKLLNLFG